AGRYGSAVPLAFGPGGKVLAVLSAEEGEVNEEGDAWGAHLRLWDVPAGRCVAELKKSNDRLPGQAGFSPDGRILALADYLGKLELPRVILWDVRTSKRLHSSVLDKIPAWAFAFSSDSRLLATVGEGAQRPSCQETLGT